MDDEEEPIRVVVRVRPIPYASSAVAVCPPDTIHVRRGVQGELQARFDAVLDPSATQPVVYAHVGPAVQSALNGLNSTIFAYGQTGSGKTHTLFGGLLEDAEEEGMAARALRQVFEQAETAEADGNRLTVSCTFLEVYNEHMTDLLLPAACAQKRNSNPGQPFLSLGGR